MTKRTRAKTQARDRLKQLLKTVDLPKEEPPQFDDMVEYSWQKPHYFLDVHMESIQQFGTLVARTAIHDFKEVYKAQFEVETTGITQYYSSALIEDVFKDSGEYYLPFKNSDEEICGLVAVDTETAIKWVIHMLGDPEKKQAEKNYLSQVEESLLADICATLVISMSNSSATRLGPEFEPAQNVLTDKYALHLPEIQEVIKFDFAIKNEEIETAVSMIIYANMLDSIVGIETVEKKKYPKEILQNAIMAKFAEVHLDMVANMGYARLSVADLLSINEGDLITTNTKLDEPISVLVKGSEVFPARPVQYMGQYAVKVEEPEKILPQKVDVPAEQALPPQQQNTQQTNEKQG